MRFTYCSLCGTELRYHEIQAEFRDEQDPHHDYHCKRWHICYDCFSELEEKRAAVKQHIEDSISADGNTTIVTKSNMIEF